MYATWHNRLLERGTIVIWDTDIRAFVSYLQSKGLDEGVDYPTEKDYEHGFFYIDLK